MILLVGFMFVGVVVLLIGSVDVFVMIVCGLLGVVVMGV